MGNKITFGLEKVHIAFMGTAQTETIEVTHGATADGEITVTVTATTLLGASSPKAVIVPMAAESHSTVTKVASAIVNVLNNDAITSGVFTASNVAGVITLVAKSPAANDATLVIAVTAGSTGVTVGASINGVVGAATGWGTPTEVPGAVGFSPKAQGKESPFYADNGLYFMSTSNNGYTADLEMALVPDTILAEMLGWLIDSNGMVVEVADAIPKHFALLGQVEGDEKNRRFAYYDCVASRPDKESKTKGESVDPATDKLSLTIAPIEINGRNVVKGVMELSASNTAAYNAFFNSVYLPVIA